MPSKKKTRSSAGFLIVAVLCGCAVFGFATYVRNGHQFLNRPAPDVTVDAAEASQPTRVHTKRSAPKETERSTAQDSGPYVLSPVMNGAKLEFTKETVQIPDDEDPKVYVVNRYLENSKIADPNARLLTVDIHDGVAELYFSGEMDKTYGTDDEATLLNGILTTLGQFPDVKSAVFYANAKQIDSFGNVDLTDPQPVIRDVPLASTRRSREPQSSESR
jgi:hypothetical protein